MSSTTPNLGLTKTTAAETIGQNWAASNDSGGNFDIIDTKMGAVGNTSVQAQLDALNSKLGFIVRSIQVPYTCEANGQFNTNLKTLIDADLPSGYTVLGVVGFTTNDVNVYMVACRYYNTAYSLQVKNIYTASISNNVVVTYLAKPN